MSKLRDMLGKAEAEIQDLDFRLHGAITENAHLEKKVKSMEAFPDLLEACKALLADTEETGATVKLGSIKAARAAIAKAEAKP
jgi:hypothetical protein